MSWLERPEKTSTNPAKKFLEWKSEEKCFSYYDKEKKENVKVPLPLSFVILEHYHTVKGWNDKSESGIYSNEVFSIGSEKMDVKAFKGGAIASGFYKDIKENVKNAGGHYCRSIYAVTNDLEIINISLKGSGVSAYSDFIKLIGDTNFDKNLVTVKGAEQLKKGKVTYSVPIFEKGAEIKDKSKLAPFAQELQEYMIAYTSNDKPTRENSAVDKHFETPEVEQDPNDPPF